MPTRSFLYRFELRSFRFIYVCYMIRRSCFSQNTYAWTTHKKNNGQKIRSSLSYDWYNEVMNERDWLRLIVMGSKNIVLSPLFWQMMMRPGRLLWISKRNLSMNKWLALEWVLRLIVGIHKKNHWTLAGGRFNEQNIKFDWICYLWHEISLSLEGNIAKCENNWIRY